MQIKSGYTLIHTDIQALFWRVSWDCLLVFKMSRHMLFSRTCQTISWMWLEQQLQLQMYCSPLLTLITQAKGSYCS